MPTEQRHTSRRVPYLSLGLLVIFLGHLFVYEPRYGGMVEEYPEYSYVFAHRGFGNHAPDNSLEGAQLALEAGMDGVDVDAQFTKDKEIVIFHDVSIERFTEGEGRVDSYTLAELQQFDMSGKYTGSGADAFSGVFMKTFDEFVSEVTPDALLMVELKVSALSATGIEERVAAVIKTHNAHDRVFISSFNPMVLYRLKHIDPEIKTVFIFTDSGWDPKRVAETKEEDRVTLPWFLRTEWTRRAIRKIINPDALSINHQVDAVVIERLLRKGWPVFIWPVNDAPDIERALTLDPFGLVSDEPLRAQELRAAIVNQ